MEKEITAVELVTWLVDNPTADDEALRAQYARLGKSEVAQLERVMGHTLSPMRRGKVARVTGRTY